MWFLPSLMKANHIGKHSLHPCHVKAVYSISFLGEYKGDSKHSVCSLKAFDLARVKVNNRKGRSEDIIGSS